VKKAFRKYLSVLVLFCLAVQLTPFGLMHSHEEHLISESVHASHNDHDHDSDHKDDGCSQIERSHDCDFCDVLIALNDQSFALSSAPSLVYAQVNNETSTFVVTTSSEVRISSTQGRAPPKA